MMNATPNLPMTMLLDNEEQCKQEDVELQQELQCLHEQECNAI